MKTKLYLAYSWDMDPEHMHQSLKKNCQYVGKTYLKGYRLCFRGDSGKAKATLEEDTGVVTPCVLWLISAKGEEILASEFEGFEKVELAVDYCGFSTKVLSFVMQPGKPLNTPAAETVEIMRAAFKLQCIPERMLNQALQYSSV